MVSLNYVLISVTLMKWHGLHFTVEEHEIHITASKDIFCDSLTLE